MKNVMTINPKKQSKPTISLSPPLTTLNTQIPTSKNSSAAKNSSYFQIPITSKHLQISPENSPRHPKHISEPRFIQKQTHFHKSKKKNKNPKLPSSAFDKSKPRFFQTYRNPLLKNKTKNLKT